MSILRTVTLHAAGGATLLTLQSRDNDASVDGPTRNLDPVQPPGSSIQGVFGTGVHQVGVLERDFALCSITSYDSVWHAKRDIDRQIVIAASVRVDGWELPLAAGSGVVEFQHLLVGFRVRLRLVPRSAHWRYLAGAKTGGTASQAGTVVTRESGDLFAASDRGSVLVFADAREALVVSDVTNWSFTTSVSQTVATQAFTLYPAATGLL